MRTVGLFFFVAAMLAGSVEAGDWPVGLSFHAAVAGDQAQPTGFEPRTVNYENGIFVDPRPFIPTTEILCAESSANWDGAPALSGKFTERGRAAFAAYTADHIGEPFAIVLNGKVLSSPIVQSPITGPAFVLTYGDNDAAKLRAWLGSSGLGPCPQPSEAQVAAEQAALRDRLVAELVDPGSGAYGFLISLARAHEIPQPPDHELLIWTQRAADAGDTSAIGVLATLYERGLDPENGSEQAFKWWLRAAEAGDSIAMFNVGWMYADGRGIAADQHQAAFWFNKAQAGLVSFEAITEGAKRGIRSARVQLGAAYAHGVGTALDFRSAVTWFQRAADDGDAQAMYELARMYERGQGVDADQEQARAWYRRAIEGGFTPAQKALADMRPTASGAPG